MALHIEMFIKASPKNRHVCSQGLCPSWGCLHYSITGKCSMALNNHVCLCVGTLNWTLSSTAGLLIKRRVLCSAERSNKEKIAFREKYLNLFNVLQHCERWSGTEKEGFIVGLSIKGRRLQRVNDKLLHIWKAEQKSWDPLASVLMVLCKHNFCLKTFLESGFSTFYGFCCGKKHWTELEAGGLSVFYE